MWKAVQSPASPSATVNAKSTQAASATAPPQTTAEIPAAPAEPALNPAVQRCCTAYQKAAAAAGGLRVPGALDAAEAAFKKALPHLSTRDSIRDFIACVTHGMVLRLFFQEEGPRLIAGARAALAALPPQPRTKSEKSPSQ